MCQSETTEGRREDTVCEVVGAEELGNGYFRLKLSPKVRFTARPGQFAMVRVREGSQPLLRRPLSLHRFDPASGEYEFLFRVVGAGTKILAGLKPGATLDVLAPLGRGFGEVGKRPLLVGGGIGIAPLMFFAEELLKNGSRPKILLGGRNERDLLCHGEFQCLALPTLCATEDGTSGTAGLVTALLAEELEKAGEAGRREISVHTCGPTPMLAAVARLCQSYSVPCEVSLESHMACGLGACLGCVVKSAEGRNLRVCKEGPVFDANLIAWP